jgi:hypothetical protein
VNWFRLGGLSACVCCCLLAGPIDCQAQTSVLTFESLAQPGTGESDWGRLYGESGFELACVNGPFGFATFQTNSPYYSGSTALFNDSSGDYTSLARTNGGYFDFISIDMAKLQFPNPGPVGFVGYRGTNQVVSTSFYLTDDGGPQRFFATNFVNLTEVRWQEGISHQFDNVTVYARPGNPPVPQFNVMAINSTVWLRGSSLRLGKDYSVEKSTDAVNWLNAGSFTAYSPIHDWAEMNVPPQTNAFYRLHWTQ